MAFRDLLGIMLFGYPVPAEMIDPAYPVFLQHVGGLSLSLMITVSSLMIGAGIGVLLALCRRETTENHGGDFSERLVSWTIPGAASIFVEAIRGLPIMLLVLLIFHLPYRLTGLRVPAIFLAIAAFSLYSGVYFSESIRSGFRSVPSGLQHAGKVLGMKPRPIFFKIELPLVFRNMLPDIINLAVTVFKDTSTLAVVAVAELTYTSRQLLMSQPMNYGFVLILALFLYWVPASLISASLVPRYDGGSDLRRPFSERMSFRKHGKLIKSSSGSISR